MKMELLFFLSLFLVFHAYLGYPLSLLAISRFKHQPIKKEPITPQITVIIAARNEVDNIGAKLENTLATLYPKDRMQVVVASDASDDGTDEVVGGFAERGVELARLQTRGGKEAAQKNALLSARGNIIVFTDVGTRIPPEGIGEIVANFADGAVGCVSSQDRFLDPEGNPTGEGAYVRYEMALRRLESKVFSLVGVSGSFFAARKEVCEKMPTDIPSDFAILLQSVKMRLRGVSDPEALGFYPGVADESHEFARKVRTVLRGMSACFKHLEILAPWRHGIFSYQLFCHKLLRWMVPIFLISAYISNLLLALQDGFYYVLLLCHSAFYLLALAGWTTRKVSLAIKIPFYFVVVNAAILAAWVKYLSGKRVIRWTPSKRK